MDDVRVAQDFVGSRPVFDMACSSERSFAVSMTRNVLSPENGALARLLAPTNGLMVMSPTVSRLYGAELHTYIRKHSLSYQSMVIQCSEDRKSLDEVASVCAAAQDAKLGRNSLIVGFGGGVCTDITSVAASLVRRGIGYGRIPTTLIGMIDAAVGIKGAVNFLGKKSYLGCFYPPTWAVIDKSFLRTLPRAFLRHGLAEMVKMAIVRDPFLFYALESHYTKLLASAFDEPVTEADSVIERSIVAMMEELQTNPFERLTYKRLVDFGHTVSPLLEAASNFTMHHGQAVAIDMAFFVTLSAEMDLLPESSRDQILDLIQSCELPIFVNSLTTDLVIKALHDAALHRGGSLNIPIPKNIGVCTFIEDHNSISQATIEQSIEKLSARHAAHANRRAVPVHFYAVNGVS